jgi:UDP-GlcNAc:undecaprenyl-phosphate/decaprenyl-phosphate GlcNAc-1-phosphate transferase
MNFLIISFLISLSLNFATIKYQHLHKHISSDYDLFGPQKFHEKVVPRIGGISIFFAIVATALCDPIFFKLGKTSLLLLQIMACALPSVACGLLEDITKRVGIKTRLIATAISAGLVTYFVNVWITNIHLPFIDELLTVTALSLGFTIIAITGLANAYNIIDGFNGLASMVAIISLLAIAYVAFKVNDPILTSTCLIVIGGITGFFVWNYPRGLIFLGDGGAYLIGFLLAVLSILLVKRNPTVSPWFALLVNAYPIFETLFTIWRRKIHQGKNPGLPDGTHFHSLIYRRLIRWTELHKTKELTLFSKNSRTSPYLWLLSSMVTFPAIIWWDKTWVLQLLALLFCVSYVWLYKAVINFRTPAILKIFK